jgi:inorganic pyrophosphatase
MTIIHIDEELNLDKTHFKTVEEFQLYLMMREKEQSEAYSLSDAHKRIIDERLKEADEAKEPGLSWEDVKADLEKGNE